MVACELELKAGDEKAALAALRLAFEREPRLMTETRDDDDLGALVSRLPEEKEE